MPKPLSLEYCFELAGEYGGECLSQVYKNNSTQMLWKCKNGHTFSRSAAHIKKDNRWCSICRKTRLPIEDAKELASNNNGKCLSDTYKNNKSKLLWECEFGHQWQQNINKIKLGHWCPRCSGREPLGIAAAHSEAAFYGGKCLSTNYKNALKPLLWECKNGHQWGVRLSSIKEGSWCPQCSKYTSQNTLKATLEIILKMTAKHNYRGFDWLLSENGNRMEIDIYFPQLCLAVEYDGEQHFTPICFGNISFAEAKKQFVIRKNRDNLKNELINNSEHIKYFIRFSYKEKNHLSNIEYIRNRLLEAGI